MVENQLNSFLMPHTKIFNLNQLKRTATIPFKDHVKFTILVDILGRKNNHHALLCVAFSPNLYPYLLEAFLLFLQQETTPPLLRQSELIFLDIEHLSVNKNREVSIENDFNLLHEKLDNADKYILIAMTGANLLTQKKQKEPSFLAQKVERLVNHPKCRLIILTQDKEYQHDAALDSFVSILNMGKVNEADIMTMLKLERSELENFHRVVIPEDLLSQAYSLTERYLSTGATLEKTFQLLDSTAARTNLLDHGDNNPLFKPALSLHTLTQVLSSWIQVPAQNLLINKFKLQEFTLGLQQKIFGQDNAITLIGHEFQQAEVHLQKASGPFCNLLLAGPKHSGKKSLSIAIAQQLFKTTHMVYLAPTVSANINSLAEMKLQRHIDKQHVALKELICETPYAIIILEDIDQAGALLTEGLQEILSTGYLHDEEGTQYNFRHAILIFTTTLGTTKLTEIAKLLSEENDHAEIELIHLVMNDQDHEVFNPHPHSPQEIADQIMPEIANYIPAALCQHLHVVPFLPLSKSAYEKIIRLKLKELGDTLTKRFGIELGYAPEVLRFFAYEMIKKKEGMEKILKPLYFTVEHAIMNQIDNKNRPNQLFLQLDETGQLLRCEWLSASARHHAS